jgi:hypothetical protein
MGQMEMKCILNIGKKYFYIGQGATQVSDVAHGPLVFFVHLNVVFSTERNTGQILNESMKSHALPNIMIQ